MPLFIVDDDPDARNSLRFLLETEGFEVEAFADGAELLGVLPEGDPSCLIIDCLMPGMDGLRVAERVRALHVTSPIIMITGHPDPTLRERAAAAGLELFEKPLSQDALLSAVRQAQR